MKKGFTLIELMIVIAIIAIIAAIAIPSLIKSKISANEGAAAAALKTFNGMMATFQKKGYNGLGRVFPHGSGGPRNSGKFCALYYEVNNAGDPVTLIGVADANADARADGSASSGGVGSYIPVIKTTGAAAPQAARTFEESPKQGYWFALAADFGTSLGYYDATQARNHYAIIAWPDDYGASGEATFAINEEGTVYTMDFGTADFIAYPGADPVAGGWEIAQ